MSNALGKDFKITSFGESHGKCVGIVIDGCPSGLKLKKTDIQKEIDRRRPGQSRVSTERKEKDRVELLSGVFNGYTTGAPLCLLVWNKDVDSSKYKKIKDLLRPGHADFTGFIKYKGFADWRGGGRFSARNTAGFVMAGAVAKKLLNLLKIEILAHTVEIAEIKTKTDITHFQLSEKMYYSEIRKNVEKNIVRCADLKTAEKMIKEIEKAKEQGDSVGGIIEAIALNLPAGLGEPIFDTLEGELAKALFAVPAVKGIEFGSGFSGAKLRGSQNNDEFIIKKGKIITRTNNSGGILGGISNGMPIVLRIAIKPTSSISKPQKTINIKTMKQEKLAIEGRHDPCIVPRAVPIIEAMVAVVLCDFALRAGLIPRSLKRDNAQN